MKTKVNKKEKKRKFEIGDTVQTEFGIGEILFIDHGSIFPYLVGIKGYQGHSGWDCYRIKEIQEYVTDKGYNGQCSWFCEETLELCCINLVPLNINHNHELQLYADFTDKLYISIGNDARKLNLEFQRRYTINDLNQDLQHLHREFLWIKINDEICGIVSIRHIKNILKISGLYIKDEFRNKGIASNCINQLIHKFGKSLILDLYYDGKAKNLYKNLGFKNKYTVMELQIDNSRG